MIYDAEHFFQFFECMERNSPPHTWLLYRMVSRVAVPEWFHKSGQRQGQLRVVCSRFLEELAGVPEEVIGLGIYGISEVFAQLPDFWPGAAQTQRRIAGKVTLRTFFWNYLEASAFFQRRIAGREMLRTSCWTYLETSAFFSGDIRGLICPTPEATLVPAFSFQLSSFQHFPIFSFSGWTYVETSAFLSGDIRGLICTTPEAI